ncbi:unnamed protein product [Rotaria magnacalcarata]|uniref:Uncharacterized protein n=4 Tax=Rotaria magnacalcarata TaxID=392030 RepID=A0A815BKY1_9BILA|nr:unnamed protein product [Rotaria magnacalcarata]
MDLQRILDDVPKKDVILIIGDWNAKVGETAVPGIVGKFDLGKCNEEGEEYNKEGMTRDLFKKIKYFRGQFTPRNDTLTDKNGKHLTNGDEIKNKWKQYIEELHKKEINGTGNLELDDYELEPDILESEVKFAIETLANGKAPGYDGIPIECFKTLKEDAVKILTKLCQQIWKTQKWP